VAIIQPVIKAELNPANPVQELCAAINAVLAFHPGQEENVLIGIQEAIDVRINQIRRGAEESAKPVLHPDTK